MFIFVMGKQNEGPCPQSAAGGLPGAGCVGTDLVCDFICLLDLCCLSGVARSALSFYMCTVLLT